MMKMLLNLVPVGQPFKFRGDIYVHDLEGRDGGGCFAVKNLKTGEKSRLEGIKNVVLYFEDDDEEEFYHQHLKDEKDGILPREVFGLDGTEDATQATNNPKINISADLSREDINELGRKADYVLDELPEKWESKDDQ